MNFLQSNVRITEVHSESITAITPGLTDPFKSRFKPPQSKGPSSTVSSRVFLATTKPTSSTTTRFPFCKQAHPKRKCSAFVNHSSRERFGAAKKLSINYLESGRTTVGCPSKYTCKVCKKPHHTLFYFPASSTINESILLTTTLLVSSNMSHLILLSTILVSITWLKTNFIHW